MGAKQRILGMKIKEISMKNIFGVIAVVMLTCWSCSDDERSTNFINNITDPSDLALEVLVSTDNSGVVTLAPSGTSVTSFVIDFGDGTGNSDVIVPGESIVHTYTEGSYNAQLTAVNSLGVSATITQEVAVTFVPPTNLSFTIEISPSNVFEIEVAPTAENASRYEIYFGDVTEEVPTMIDDGQTAFHVYATEGTFDVRVVAKNGGITTIEETQSVTIESPARVLPLDFEDDTVDYGIFGFEGADSMVVMNPVSTGINTSSRVVESIKTDGALFYAGTVIPLEAPIDFSTTQKIAIKTYSPKANIPIRLKIETASGGSEFIELDRNTTVANEWEEIVWDFTGDPQIGLDFVQIVIFFEFVVDLSGDGSTYYFDDIQLKN